MSIVKSLTVGNGDMFYIKHGSDNFSVIDCCLDEKNKERIVNEIKNESKSKNITRFMSTHPDEDHIQGLEYLDSKWSINNFYCVKNEASKEDETESFKKYCKLRDSDKAFYTYKGCKRKWMNLNSSDSDEVKRGSSGINILWPDTDNDDFKAELEKVKNGESPNNISMIIQYKCNAKFLFMGDIETVFLEKIKEEIDFEEVDIVFAPHHGRESGKIPSDILEIINPKIIVIGEAPSAKLNYYSGYNTITQNSAGDIIFEVIDGLVNIYVSNSNYSVNFLKNKNKTTFDNYIGSLEL